MANPSNVVLIDDKNHANDLLLKVNGKDVLIKEAELAQLLQPVQAKELNEKNPKSKIESPDSPVETMSRHGLKSAKDVISFLKSPTGEKAKGLIHDQLALLVGLKAMSNEQYVRKELLRQLFMANLRLMKVAKRKADAKELNAAYQRQIDKSLAYGREVAQQSITSSDRSSAYSDEALRKQILGSYDLATKLVEDDLQEKLVEQQEVEAELAALELEAAQIHERYAVLENHLQVLDDHFDILETMQSRAERIEATEAVLAVIRGGMSEVTANIQQHVNNGEDDQAELLLTHLDGLHVQVEGMRMMMDVIHERKAYFDHEGKQTDSYKKAAYAVSAAQQLHKDENSGKIYLLQPGQKFADLTVDEKADAHQGFEDTKTELATIKMQVNQNKSTETALFEEKKRSLVERSMGIKNAILDLTNQQNQLKAAKASAVALMKQPNADLSRIPTPQPTLAPKANQPEEKWQISSSQRFKQELEAIRFNPSQEAIDHLKNRFVNSNGQPNKAAQEIISNTIRPNEPLLHTKMNSMLQNLERLGVLANKPAVTAIPSKHPNKLENQKPEEAPSTSPTPFKTTPSPFNKG